MTVRGTSKRTGNGFSVDDPGSLVNVKVGRQKSREALVPLTCRRCVAANLLHPSTLFALAGSFLWGR